MKGLEALLNPDEHLTEDERGEQAEHFYTELALLRHMAEHGIDPDAVSARECAVCGNTIPDVRRKILPGVTECVDCAAARELRDRRYG